MELAIPDWNNTTLHSLISNHFNIPFPTLKPTTEIRSYHLLRTLPVLALAGLITVIASAAKPRFTEAMRDARKADYIYLEAVNYQASNKTDAYFSMIERAHQLNPTDDFLSMQYGLKLLLESSGDSMQVIEGLDRMQAYSDAHPEDFYNMLNYASICGQLGQKDRALATWETLYARNPDRIEVGGMYADALAQSGDSLSMRKAIDIYNDIDRTEGVNSTTSTRKMRIYNALGDTASIKNEMHALMNSSPSSSEYAALAGTLYKEFGDKDSALVFFNRAVELDPSSGSARYQRALFYESIGDSARYDSELFQALELPDLELQPKLSMLYDYVSKLYTDSLHQPRIESMFQSLISQYPHEASVRNLYGDYLVTIGRLAPAAEQIGYAVDSDPSDVKRWQMLGSLYYSVQDYDKALATINDALRYHPDVADIYTMASSVLIQKKDYPQAIEYLNRGLAVVDSTDTDELSTINCAIADTYYSEGSVDSAFMYYERSLKYNPDNMLALNNSAYYLACQEKDLDRALTMIERVVKNDPQSSTSLDTYAWVLFKMKNYAKAREIIDGAIANDENPDSSSDILEHAGDIYFMDGQPDKALEFWNKALKLKPDDELLRRKVKHKTFFYK